MRIGLDTKPLILHTAYTLTQKQIHFCSHLCVYANWTERERKKKVIIAPLSYAHTTISVSFIISDFSAAESLSHSCRSSFSFSYSLSIWRFIVGGRSSKYKARKHLWVQQQQQQQHQHRWIFVRCFCWCVINIYYDDGKQQLLDTVFPIKFDGERASERPTDCAWSEWAGSKARQKQQKDNEQ